MKFIAFAIGFALILAGCAPMPFESESRYAMGRTMTPQAVQRCRVLDLRTVYIGAQTTNGYGNGQTQSAPWQKGGTLAGAAIGAGIVKALGSNNEYAMLAGALIGSQVGAVQGNRVDMRSPTRQGYEYSVLLSDGRELVITQPIAETDRIAQPGSTCRLVGSGNSVRVLPGDHLPTSIHAPAQTRFR